MVLKLVLSFLITMASFAAPKVGDYVIYQVSNHLYNDYPESFAIKVSIDRYDFIANSLKISVELRSDSGAVIPTNDHWVSPKYFEPQQSLGASVERCYRGKKEFVTAMNGETMQSCRLHLIESALAGAINPTNYIGFEYIEGWISDEVPITGMVKVQGRLWGAVVSSYGNKAKFPILRKISDKEYFTRPKDSVISDK